MRGVDQWALPNDLFLKLMHRKPRLKEYFNFYRCQLNFALFASTSSLGISKEHLTVSDNLIRSLLPVSCVLSCQKNITQITSSNT